MRCPRCENQLVHGHCPACGAVYLPRCPECGNTLEFESFDEQGVEFLRCGRCANETVFEWVNHDNRPDLV
ncbi:MAG: hypothetical protein QJR13_04360 [Bacillota bacterium]|nr:hypothetical protein [Bacillota bacterium]